MYVPSSVNGWFVCLLAFCVSIWQNVFTRIDYQSCTYVTNFHTPGIYGNGRAGFHSCGNYFVPHRLEVVALAGLLEYALCAMNAAAVVDLVYFIASTRPVARMRPPCLIYISTAVRGQLLACRQKILVILRQFVSYKR